MFHRRAKVSNHVQKQKFDFVEIKCPVLMGKILSKNTAVSFHMNVIGTMFVIKSVL